MADARSILVLDSTGAPLTVATPSFVDYRDTAGNPRTPPAAPSHLGGGVWAFTPSDADETTGTVALVDFGAGAEPRRVTWALHLADGANQFWATHIEDGAGALWTGAAPTVGLYDDSAGSPRTPPALAAVSGAYLYALVPTAADVAAGVEGRLDGPASSAVPYWSFSSVPTVSGGGGSPWEAPSPGPIRNPAFDVAQFLTTKTVGGVVLTVGTNLFVSREPDTDRAPALSVACLNTGGAAPEPYLDDSRRSFFSSSVQVLVRSNVDDFEAGERVARGIIEWCHQRVAVGYVTWLSRDSQPAYLGPDSNHRHTWAVNLDAEYDAALG